MKKGKASVPYDPLVVNDLRQDPALAAEYLRAAMEDEEEPAALLIALRHIAEAYGFQAVAQNAGLNRESLYRALSPKGNPTLKTMNAVLKAVGVKLSVEPLATRHVAQ